MSSIDEAVAAIRAGEPVVLPFDTVYGLAADPYGEEPVRRLYELKGRPATQPSAIVASDLDLLLECVPELRGRPATIARALLPGPWTLVFPNPSRRFRWLTGTNDAAIGVRVPELEGAAAEVLEAVGAVVATSANKPGEPEAATLAAVPAAILEAVGAALDGGALPGTPSTVIDFTGAEPRVLREGAAPASEAFRRLRAPVRSS
jgi:L-threonylcarbamoyladenylate synthase